jgi:Tfp pilus assembly protein FimT
MNSKGFSLTELLLILTIITILSTIGIASLKFFQQKSQAQVLLSTLLRAIQFTRSAAISRHEKITLCPAGSWQDGFVVKTSEKVLYVLQNLATSGELHWRAFPANRQQLDFLPSGFPPTENGTFWFCISHAAEPMWAVIMNRFGRVRTAYPDKQGNILDSKGIPLTC